MGLYTKRYGQLDPAEIAAVLPVDGTESPTGIPFTKLFFVSVAAGVTVWFVTKILERR